MNVIEKEFDALASTYETNRLAPWYRAHSDEILKKCPSMAQGDILDVGCGTGYLLRNILGRNPGARGVGLDISSGMISEADRKAQQERISNVEFIKTDFEKLDASMFETYNFKIVVCASTFHYFADPLQAAIMLRSVLGAGGTLYLLERDKARSPLTRLWGFLHRNCIKDRVEFYDQEELGRIFRQAGFKDPEAVQSIRRYFWKGKLFTSIVLNEYLRH